MPQLYVLAAFTSVIALVGLLKVEEIIYMFMGSLSQSVLSLKMPFPDIVKGAKHPGVRRSFVEELSSMRALDLLRLVHFLFTLRYLLRWLSLRAFILVI